MGNNCASSHKIKYIDILSDILNLEGHHNRCIGLKVTAILLNELILPTGGVAWGRVCAISLCSSLVFRGVTNHLKQMFSSELLLTRTK